jgi:hypothetical protein
LFAPYCCIESGDLEDGSSPATTSVNDVSLESFVGDFPVLDHVLLTRSDASHYHTFRSILAQFQSITNQAKQNKCVEVLKCLIATMPQYPPSMVQPFSEHLITMLDGKCPELLARIIMRNPSFVPGGIDRPTVTISLRIGEILSVRDPQMFDDRIVQFTAEMMMEQAERGKTILRAMVDRLFEEDRVTMSVYQLIFKLIPFIPDSILFVRCPESGLAISALAPWSLIKPQQFCGAVAFGLIRLYRFAYSAVQAFAKSQTLTNLVPWHRLSISGASAVDALVFAIWRSGLGVWQFKNARSDSKLAFGSIIASLLTCVEMPTVGNMVRCCRR